MNYNINAGGGSQKNKYLVGGLHNTHNEEIFYNKEKSIYVGQWDTIKEKMVWQAIEKDFDGSVLKSHLSINEHIEELFIPARRAKGEG